MVAQRVLDHPAALTECLDLRAVDVRKFEAAFLVRESDLVSEQLQLAREIGAIRGADQLGMLEEFFVGERPPLPVAAFRHVHDDHVRMQLRVLGPRQFVLERRRNQVACLLTMAPAPHLLARMCVFFHQRDRSAHCLVVRFDDGLVPRDQRLQGDAFRGGEREVPAVPLRGLACFERLRYTASVRQPPFEQRPKARLVHFALQPELLGTSAQPDATPFFRVVVVLRREIVCRVGRTPDGVMGQHRVTRKSPDAAPGSAAE